MSKQIVALVPLIVLMIESMKYSKLITHKIDNILINSKQLGQTQNTQTHTKSASR